MMRDESAERKEFKTLDAVYLHVTLIQTYTKPKRKWNIKWDLGLREHLSSILFGDSVVLNIKEDYILLWGFCIQNILSYVVHSPQKRH